MNHGKYTSLMLIVSVLNIIIIRNHMSSASAIDSRNIIPTLDEVISANLNSNGTWIIPNKNNSDNVGKNTNLDKETYNQNGVVEEKYRHFNAKDTLIDSLSLSDDNTLIENERNFKEDLEKKSEVHSDRVDRPSLQDILTENAFRKGTWKEPQNISTINDSFKNIDETDREINSNIITKDFDSSNFHFDEENNYDVYDTANFESIAENQNILNLPMRQIPSLDDILLENVHTNGTWKENNGTKDISVPSESLKYRNYDFTRDVNEVKEEIDYSLTDEIKRDLPDLIKQGVRNAEKILEDILKVREKMVRENREPSSTSSHGRSVDPESRQVGYCRGLAMTETTKLIVEKYNLTSNKIVAILSSINVEPHLPDFRTKYCKDNRDKERQLTSAGCDPKYPYRTITGKCNNLNPAFVEKGASNTPFARFIRPQYGDGFNSLRGDNLPPSQALPNPRTVSRSISLLTDPSPDIHMTQMLKAWGQITDHDLTFTLEGEGHCCDFPNEEPISTFPDCRPIDVRTDPFFSQFGVRCLRFIRNTPAGTATIMSPREQINTLTAFIDASNVYGSTVERADELRAFVDGRMKENSRGEDGFCSTTRHCKFPFLPERPNGTLSVLLNAGDVRVNEQPGLIAMHTLLFRFHNKVAEELKEKHPDFNDTILFEESRRIVIASVQHITYNEFLPLLLGKSFATDFKLYSLTSGYYNGYNVSIDPSVRNEFATFALRIGHTLIGKFISGKNSITLETSFNRPTMMLNESEMFPSNVLKGECLNPSERYDIEIVDAVVNKLLAGPPFAFGADLVSLNIQRGRDHGLPAYNVFRVFCGKTAFTSFDHMRQELNPAAVDVFQRLYRSVDDVDIFPGAISEPRTTFGFIGDTLSCILARQFHIAKHGDRFWYENSIQPKPFTPAQLSSIRNTSLAAVLCATSSFTTIQSFPMLSKQLSKNQERPCSDFLSNSVFSLIEKHW